MRNRKQGKKEAKIKTKQKTTKRRRGSIQTGFCMQVLYDFGAWPLSLATCLRSDDSGAHATITAFVPPMGEPIVTATWRKRKGILEKGFAYKTSSTKVYWYTTDEYGENRQYSRYNTSCRRKVLPVLVVAILFMYTCSVEQHYVPVVWYSTKYCGIIAKVIV